MLKGGFCICVTHCTIVVKHKRTNNSNVNFYIVPKQIIKQFYRVYLYAFPLYVAGGLIRLSNILTRKSSFCQEKPLNLHSQEDSPISSLGID